MTTAATTLCSLLPGQLGRISSATLDAEDAALLRAMGLRRDAVVRLCRSGEPCIVAVECEGGGCRIGLARRLAAAVVVQPMA